MTARDGNGGANSNTNFAAFTTARPPDPNPTASRVSPSSGSITLPYGTNQRFSVRGEDDGGDLWKVEWQLSGPVSETDTDSDFFSGSNDTTDFKDLGDYTFDTAGDYTLTATVYDNSGDTDSVSWSIHVDSPSVDRFDGQVIYLDFDGAEDVTYNGPVTVGPFDVPAFEAPGELAGQEEAIIASAAYPNIVFTFTDTERREAEATMEMLIDTGRLDGRVDLSQAFVV